MAELIWFLVGVLVGGLVIYFVARNNKKKFIAALSYERDDIIKRVK